MFFEIVSFLNNVTIFESEKFNVLNYIDQFHNIWNISILGVNLKIFNLAS